ncbi:MAG: Retaining alpha-galactosidase precursor [Bacteroidetes bacterium]|nr:Retaining alpha-galactosidase precursor [Bacteroidota bacterium]
MKNSLVAFLLIILATPFIQAQRKILLSSPDSRLTAEIRIGQTIDYSVSHNGDVMLAPSAVAMQLGDGVVLGAKPVLIKSVKRSADNVIRASVYKKSIIQDRYNELTLNFKGNYQLVFRAYNDGIAYRFITSMKDSFVVENEKAEFNFPTNQKIFVAYVDNRGGAKDTFEKQFYNSFENTYQHILLSEYNPARIAFTPLVVEGVKGKKVCIAESDLLSYPGMFLCNDNASNSLKGVFAPYPKTTRAGGHNLLQDEVMSGESFIAKCAGKTSFPWRSVIVAENAYELANSDMVYKLATPSQLTDVSWIKPGKVAWDWWNDWNLYGVDFETGVNTQTYKAYIDFAAEYGIQYVILDEGWAVNLKNDLLAVVPEINLGELIAYAKSKNVDLILWAGYNAFNKDIDGVCKHYSEMGIKGFKIDFMDRDDQPMVDFHYRTAKIAAKYKLLVDFHGTYKPTGLQRTFPNVINFEAVHGLEQMKWSDTSVDQVTYDVTIPFIRMVAGPMDYTQGAMRNSTKGNYRPVNSEPMSQGTRCRQLAEYVIFESPLNMLCDNPSNYIREKECAAFIAQVPTVWDETIALNGQIAQYVTIARRKGNDWYLGSMTNWDARTLEIDLSFLGQGRFSAEVFSDGKNANKVARDYLKQNIEISPDKKLKIAMAPGGGFVMKISKL